MPIYTDQTGKTVLLPATPVRIVSLVPSQTELLYDLGLDDAVAGITKFCTHPPHWFRHKTRIGGTKSVHIDQVKAIRPDLIIANKEENVQAQVEELAAIFPVWTSDISNLPQALQMIEAIGLMTGTAPAATPDGCNDKKSLCSIADGADRHPYGIFNLAKTIHDHWW